MIIRLHEIRDQGEQTLNFTDTVDLTDVSHVVEPSPVSVTAIARFRNGMYVIEGAISGTVPLYCSRCLKEITHPFDIEWRLLLTDRPSEEDDGEEHVHYIPNNETDLLPFIREELLLELPMGVVCEAQCRGLCPKCGVNLNETDCDCSFEQIDPRLVELEKFFTNND